MSYPMTHQPPSYYPPAQAPPVTNQSQSTNIVVNAGGGGGVGGKKGALGSGRTVYRRWSTQRFACMEDVSGCCCAICCAPCFMMNLATRLDEFCLLPFCVPQALLVMFVKVRSANAIKGSICYDCIWTTCCPTLAACQLKRELDNIDMGKPGTEL